MTGIEYDRYMEAAKVERSHAVSEFMLAAVNKIEAAVKYIVLANTRRRAYNDLNSMNDRMLKDIGLSRCDIRNAVYNNNK